jgi:predicted double-glycine peptidase
VRATIQSPARTAPTQDHRHNRDGSQNDEPATVYYRNDGHYVVCNDLTGDIVQVSDTHDPNWIDPFANPIKSP